jgi:hypothetical protein
LAISDRNVTSFDIGSRDKPVKTAELDLSNPAYRMAELPNHVASITSDWWTGEVLLSVTPKQNADDAEVSGKLSLASLAAVNAAFCSAGRNAWASWYAARLFTQGNLVYVTVPVYTYEGNARGGKLVVGAVDASNPAAPVLVGKTEVKFTDRSNSGYYGYGFYGDGFWDGWSYSNYLGGMNNSLVASGQGIVQVGSKLAYLELDQEWIPNTTAKPYTTWSSKLHRKLHVVDMTNPSNPVAAAPISLADSLGSSPLHVYEGKVLTSRWVKTGQTKGKVRFYMDQVDLKGPTPGILPSINIPGSLLLADEASHRIVTADYSVKRTSASTWSDCQAKLGYRGRFFDAFKECLAVDRQFKLADVTGTKVTLRQTMVPPSQNFAGIQIADDRIYVTRYRRYESNAVGVSYPGGPSSNGQPKIAEDGGLWAIGGIRSGQMGIVSEFVGDAEWPLAASGTRVALYTQGGVAFYDTATAKPTLLKEVNLRGAGYTSHVLMGRDRAICSLGDWGMQSVRY